MGGCGIYVYTYIQRDKTCLGVGGGDGAEEERERVLSRVGVVRPALGGVPRPAKILVEAAAVFGFCFVWGVGLFVFELRQACNNKSNLLHMKEAKTSQSITHSRGSPVRKGTTPKAKIQVWAMGSLRPLRSRLFRLCGGVSKGVGSCVGCA